MIVNGALYSLWNNTGNIWHTLLTQSVSVSLTNDTQIQIAQGFSNLLSEILNPLVKSTWSKKKHANCRMRCQKMKNEQSKWWMILSFSSPMWDSCPLLWPYIYPWYLGRLLQCSWSYLYPLWSPLKYQNSSSFLIERHFAGVFWLLSLSLFSSGCYMDTPLPTWMMFLTTLIYRLQAKLHLIILFIICLFS